MKLGYDIKSGSVCRWRTVGRRAVAREHLVFRLVGVEEQQVVQVADAVSQRADGEIFRGEGHQVPHHPLS